MKTLHGLYRTLGSTGVKVSPIGLGTVKIGRDKGVKYPHAFTIPQDDEVRKLLKIAYELGINTLDTAPAYGNSEERLGQLISNRNDWVIISKAGETFVDGVSQFNFTAQHIKESVERSLKRLKTDYIDVLLIHSDGNDQIINDDPALWDSLECLKSRGLVRAFGLSGKTVDGGISALQKSDCAMVTFNLNDQTEKPVIDYAKKHGKGILVKKALASGHVCKDTGSSSLESSFELVFSQSAVASAIIGTINQEHLQQNIEIAAKSLANYL